MNHQYCGLDFGTSNSTIGVAPGGVARLCPLEKGHATLPSAIFFNFEDDEVEFGRAAMSTYIDGVPGRLLRSLKSLLGSSLINERTQIKRRRMPLADVIGLFVGHLKGLAEASVHGPIDSVVAGRPVRFVDGDDAADREAEDELARILRGQGFAHVEFQYEPVAAALNYEASLEREELVLVVDLGGGTSDFALTRLSPERRDSADRSGDILGRTGVHVGGTDFDRLLSVAEVMPHLGHRTLLGAKKLRIPSWIFHDLATWHRIHSLYTSENLAYLRSVRSQAEDPRLIERLMEVIANRDGHRLANAVERAKVTLSSRLAADIPVPLGEGLTIEATRSQFEDAIGSPLSKIAQGIRTCLEQAGVGADAIDAAFLTGGSTVVPIVRRKVLAMLPRARAIDGDAFGSVGTGLAIDAHRRFGTGPR